MSTLRILSQVVVALFLTHGSVLGFVEALSSTNYLDSLSGGPPASPGTRPPSNIHQNPSAAMSPPVVDDLEDVASITPDDHYARYHPGAGWAGYNHPQFGGYLDAMSSPTPHDGEAAPPYLDNQQERGGGSTYLNTLKENAREQGKEADYRDDIRWGAQVYLDGI